MVVMVNFLTMGQSLGCNGGGGGLVTDHDHLHWSWSVPNPHPSHLSQY